MLVSFNNAPLAFQGLRTGILKVKAEQLGVPVERLGELGYVNPKTRPLPPFNSADYEIIPSEIIELSTAEKNLYFRDLYFRTKKQLQQAAIKFKACKFGIKTNAFEEKLSADEQMALISVKRKLDFAIALNRTKLQ